MASAPELQKKTKSGRGDGETTESRTTATIEVAVRVRPAPVRSRYEAFVVDGWQAGADAVRALAQSRVLADVTRLSDVDETEVQLALSGGIKSRALNTYLRARGIRRPCLLILGWDAATRGELKRRRADALRALRDVRKTSLGRAVGESWQSHRFSGPRQRDALLDRGVCVETLETATSWTGLSELRSAVRTALVHELRSAEHQPIVMCHVSHAYETGASLYFTVLAPRDENALEQWAKAKRAAGDAIAGRGTISHHHAVGVDHRPWLKAEIGEIGDDVLAAAKQAVDPQGILNPGKLVRD